MSTTAINPRLRRPISLKSTFVGLNTELALLGPVYERLRPLELEAWPTLSSLVGRLTEPAKQQADGHRALICSILAIHQSAPHRVWVAILMRTFRPMLRKVLKRLIGADRQELVALLLVSFQEAIRTIDPHRDPLRIAMYVRQATRRALFAQLRREFAWREVGFGDDVDEQPDVDSSARPLAIEWLRDTPEGDRELVATIAEHGALLNLVRDNHAGACPREQLRIYAHLRRRRDRLAADLRDRLGQRPSTE